MQRRLQAWRLLLPPLLIAAIGTMLLLPAGSDAFAIYFVALFLAARYLIGTLNLFTRLGARQTPSPELQLRWQAIAAAYGLALEQVAVTTDYAGPEARVAVQGVRRVRLQVQPKEANASSDAELDEAVTLAFSAHRRSFPLAVAALSALVLLVALGLLSRSLSPLVVLFGSLGIGAALFFFAQQLSKRLLTALQAEVADPDRFPIAHRSGVSMRRKNAPPTSRMWCIVLVGLFIVLVAITVFTLFSTPSDG